MFERTYKAIEKRVQDNWVTTPVDYDNGKFTPTAGTPYIRLQIEFAGSDQISVGGLERGVGLIYVSIFVTKGDGSRAATTLADTIRTLFKNQYDDGVRYLASYLQRVGEQNEWYQLNVLIPFKSDECN